MSPHTLPAPVKSVIFMGQQLWLGMPDGGSRPPLTLFLLRLTWTTPYRSIRADSGFATRISNYSMKQDVGKSSQQKWPRHYYGFIDEDWTGVTGS
jgi:hypothetical protein